MIIPAQAPSFGVYDVPLLYRKSAHPMSCIVSTHSRGGETYPRTHFILAETLVLADDAILPALAPAMLSSTMISALLKRVQEHSSPVLTAQLNSHRNLTEGTPGCIIAEGGGALVVGPWYNMGPTVYSFVPCMMTGCVHSYYPG